MALDLTGIGTALGSIGGIVAPIEQKLLAFIPDPDQRAKAAQAVNDGIMTVIGNVAQQQGEIDRVEAASGSLFVAGWRPFIGWVCGAALTYQFVAMPLGSWIAAAAGHPLPTAPTLDGSLWELMFGMLGLGSLRTLEKLRAVR